MAEKESAGQLLIPMEKVAGELVAQLKSQPMLQLTLPDMMGSRFRVLEGWKEKSF